MWEVWEGEDVPLPPVVVPPWAVCHSLQASALTDVWILSHMCGPPQAFLDFLEERGVTAELGGYLRSMHFDKEAEEYMAWLTKVKDFVAQK